MTAAAVTSRADYLERAAQRRESVYTRIATSISERGYPPSVGELADAEGVSKVLIRRDLAQLAKAGRIEVDPGVARGIRLT